MSQKIKFSGKEVLKRTHGKPIVSTIDPDLAIGDYLETICERIMVDPEDYVLMKDGEILDDNMSVVEAGIEHGDKLVLVIKISSVKRTFELINVENQETIRKKVGEIGREDIKHWRSGEHANPQTSRRHFAISFDGDSFFIKDLQSLNGTWVNDKRLRSNENAIIQKGDIISLSGDYIRLEFNPY